MAVIVKYVVVRDGKEDMIFTTKREAEAYDKMLDVAEQLQAFLQAAEVDVPEDTLENLTFFMAKNRDELGKLLKGGKLKGGKSEAPEAEADVEAESDVAAEASTEADARPAARPAGSPRGSRGTRPKAVA